MFVKSLAAALLAISVLTAPTASDAHGWRSDEKRPLIERSVAFEAKVRNETLPLRKILELGKSFNGKKLQSIEIDIKPRGRTSRFLLLGDGKIIGEAWSGRGDSYVIVEPYGRTRLGRDFRRLQLAVEGSARIERLSAQFQAERKHRRSKKHRHHSRNHHTHDHKSGGHDRWRYRYGFPWDYGVVRW